ncbi:hypothetical protein TH606_10880 [Thermodesulfatator autotrophicus]|uniref:CRISPR system ring nuclease SSO1393-like domain-containing protein n=1 Tax=Thermodesulfatator autotrophicus TaxID=1795632 RepID=A0A177E4Q4_9BACT|nr:hypothetical protein TH606_10880 [Thermodesulfatator autotrophicus]
MTNRVSPEVRALVFKHANAPGPITGEEGETLTRHLEKRREEVLGLPPQGAALLSAEINGLYHLYAGDFANGKQDTHILLATDTWLGRETAQMVSAWLKTQGIANVQVWDDIGGLRTDSLENFHLAVAELVRRLHETLPGYKEIGYQIIFNLTGGFKSIQGVLQTLAQFYADEAVYIFETSKELLRIPRLPLTLDILPSIKKQLKIWRRLALGLSVTPEECRKIPNAFWFAVGDEVSLSPWGELIWQQVKRQIYEECLWEPPSDRITWTDEFEKAVNALPPDRRYEVNKRMDELALHLEREDHPNPRSLNCHRLSGEPVAGCTHEIYAWSDRDARRIYGVCHGHERFER